MNRNGSRALLSRELGRARKAPAEIDHHARLGKRKPVLFRLHRICGDEVTCSTVHHGWLRRSAAVFITLGHCNDVAKFGQLPRDGLVCRSLWWRLQADWKVANMSVVGASRGA